MTGPQVEPYGHVPVPVLWVCTASVRPGPCEGRRSTHEVSLAGHWLGISARGGGMHAGRGGWAWRLLLYDVSSLRGLGLRCERVRRSALWPLRKADGGCVSQLAGYGDGVLGRALVEPYYFLLLCW